LNWSLLINSLLVSGLATLLALAFGFLGALCLATLPKHLRSLFLAAAIIALALPPFLVTNCWLHFLGHTGVWHSWLPLNIISLGGTVCILSLLLWPIPLLVALSAWHRLQPAQLESDMAVTGWALIRGLLFPLARNALALAAMLTFVLALNNFAVPAILQVKVFPEEMWVRFNTSFDTIGAVRLSLPLVVGPLLLVLLLAKREIPWPHLQAPVPATLFRQQLGLAWFLFCACCTTLACFLSAGLPLYQLLSTPRTWTELSGALLAGQSATWNSFWLAATSATLIVAVSLVWGGGLTGRKQRHNAVGDWFAGILWLPFLLPGVLLGIGLIAVLNRPWYALFYQSAGIVILAFVIRYLALGWNAVAHASQAVDRDLLDVARLEGATRWQMLRHVHWPQIAPQVLAAWYILFLLCLWDVESMILVVPPGGETLALRIFNLLHYGHNAQVNALCLLLLLLALAPLAIWRIWGVAGTRPAGITHHASFLMLLAASAISCTSCSRSASTNDVPLKSRLFSRAQVIGTRGVGVGQLNKPRSVAVDAQDNVYVVDMTGRVQKFSTNGTFLLSWQMPQIERGKPKGMGHDRAGNILLVEPHYSRVNIFSPEGKLLAQWGQHGTNVGHFGLPRAVAVNSHGEFFIGEYQENERVQKFGFADSAAAIGDGLLAPPRCLGVIGKGGTGPGEFNRPEGLAIDAQDRLYVADSCNHRIQVFSSEGKFLRAYGKPGNGKGEFSYPYDICVDAAGRQYVCEFGNSRIQVFDANDQPIEIIGGPGAEPGQFNDPWGVALDSAGNLYVADSQNHRVQKLIRNPKVEALSTKGGERAFAQPRFRDLGLGHSFGRRISGSGFSPLGFGRTHS
jgi:ABC-type Fe3+ transport system permease subunit/DNA-binding beta-propeller fold protein YncE